MIDERDVREMLERRVRTISATPADTPKAVRRARRRLALNAAVGTLVGLAVLAGALAGVRTIQAGPTPATPPTPSPVPARSSSSLAYGLDGDIYVADWDGSHAVRIADGRPADDCHGLGEYWAEGPMWSPDGRYLAYRQTDCEGARRAWWDVVISDVEGNVVATFPGEGWLISWSPDSTRVAVWVRWGDTIGIYGLDGVRQTVLTVPPGLMAPGDYDPVWSRDGASLLVPHGVEIPLDGSTPRKLPADDPRSSDAVYSPDESRAAYSDARGLVVASADGSETRVLVPDRVWNWSLAWSPTGDRIAFVYQTSETANGFAAATELRVVDVASGTVTRLAGMDGTAILENPRFSPDGDRILFTRRGDGTESLWTVRADGSDVRRLVAGSSWGEWQPPGNTR